MKQLTQEIHRFLLGDYSGMIESFDAAKIMGWDYDELEKACAKEAREQLRGVKGNHYFQFQREVNVLRYRDHPEERHFHFKFRREDCVRYSRKYGPLALPRPGNSYPATEKK